MSTRQRVPAGDLQLGLFIGSSADIVTLDQFLRLEAGRRAELDVTPSAACISLEIDGQERWGPRLSFGALGMLVDQLLPARDRLRDCRRAVIRAGGFDGPVNEYVVLDPHGPVLTATVAATDAEAVWLWLPMGPDADALYTFVDEHLATMLEMGQQIRDIAPVTAGTDAIIAALEREAERGAAAVALLGPGVT